MSKHVQTDRVLSRPVWWLLFLAATYVMSQWFQTFRVFTITPSLENGLVWLGANLLLFVNVAVLVYDSYVQEKGRGQVQKPLRLFEWMYRRQFLLKDRPRQEGDLS